MKAANLSNKPGPPQCTLYRRVRLAAPRISRKLLDLIARRLPRYCYRRDITPDRRHSGIARRTTAKPRGFVTNMASGWQRSRDKHVLALRVMRGAAENICRCLPVVVQAFDDDNLLGQGARIRWRGGCDHCRRHASRAFFRPPWTGTMRPLLRRLLRQRQVSGVAHPAGRHAATDPGSAGCSPITCSRTATAAPKR